MRTDAVQIPMIDKKIEITKIMRFMKVVIKKEFYTEARRQLTTFTPFDFNFWLWGFFGFKTT